LRISGRLKGEIFMGGFRLSERLCLETISPLIKGSFDVKGDFMDYRYETTTVGGFVQQLTLYYLVHGYWFYVQGTIPESKDLAKVDEKLLTKYQVSISKSRRCRCKKQKNISGVQYLRYERTFLLLATHGSHNFFKEESQTLKDVRREPIKFRGYSIGYNNGHPTVSLARDTYRNLHAYFLELAVHRSADCIAQGIKKLPYEAYSPVRRQLSAIVKAVNKRRKAAGFAPVPYSCLPARRHIFRPFEPLPASPAGGDQERNGPGVKMG